MTTFALIAGMMPVAIGIGQGGEFYRPMAVAIIGGTITSTLLTLLVVPTFYDSIEIWWERVVEKYHERAERWNPSLAFLVTFFVVVSKILVVGYIFGGISFLVIAAFSRKSPKKTGAAGPINPVI